MSARSYMSIGDVLSLLRQEFPDVTISKIRFLESQGLVNPERTPSGYRKFYEHDVERLRWVLRQQREHFLPLKVIKDRLDDDPVGSQATPSRRAAAGAVATDEASPDGQSQATAGDESVRPVLVGQRTAPEGGTRSTLPGIESSLGSATVATPTSSTAAGGPPSAGAGTGPGSSVTSPPAAAEAVPVPAPDQRSTTATGGSDPHAASSGAAVASAARRSRSSGDDGEPAPSRGKATAPPAGGSGSPAGTRPGRDGATESPRRSSKSPGSASSGRTGSSLSVDELSSACGLEVAVLRELEEFGLLASTNVAGIESFGEEALAVAQLAAQFARFGIEPRHLRLYKNAADREAGFVEQIVLPLVRQRNPEARARAQETADELALLGQQLRSSLLRSALGDLLEG
jgi:DNA-binding transcriptional MerR regulator